MSNVTLKHLKFSSFVGLNMQMINKLVFNDTSIDSLCDSNHTLESIRNSNGQGNRLPTQIYTALYLNKIPNKKTVRDQYEPEQLLRVG